MPKARIYRPSKNAMQSGRGKTKGWLLVYEPQRPMTPESLMGWNTMLDTTREITLRFPSEAAAIEYAKKQGLEYEIFAGKQPSPKIRPYAENFSYKQRNPYGH